MRNIPMDFQFEKPSIGKPDPNPVAPARHDDIDWHRIPAIDHRS
jgi:hypothetical protein